MKKRFDHYMDEEAMTRSVLKWVADPSSQGCDEVIFWVQCGLSLEASHALIHSPAAPTITTLTFHEIYFSPEQLAEILTLPALVTMELHGGSSQDWGGMEFTFPTLAPEHWQVLMNDPNAQRLRTLKMNNQQYNIQMGSDLRRALPHLDVLCLDWVYY